MGRRRPDPPTARPDGGPAGGPAGPAPSVGPSPRPRPDRPGHDPLVRLRATLRYRGLRRRATALAVAAAVLLAGSGPLRPDRTPDGAAGVPTGATTEPAVPPPDGPVPPTDGGSSPPDDNPRRLAPGERAGAVPSPGPALFDQGDHVDLVAVAVGPTGEVVTTVLQPPGRVIAVDTGVVVVALPADDAVAVIDHLATGAVELLGRP
ncbi:MAG: hypothetical protein ACK5RL_08745 [Acidimicrobiales bacterium]